MDELLPTSPRIPREDASPLTGSSGANALLGKPRRNLRRRLLALLAAGGVAFALTTWTLVRVEEPLGPVETRGDAAGPESVVRAQLDSMARGELRTAYAFFSARYREQVPFEAYHLLVSTHPEMFRAREVHVNREEQWGGRAVLVARLLAETGKRYRARFTLVRAEGRWWIDDLRWGLESAARDTRTL